MNQTVVLLETFKNEEGRMLRNGDRLLVKEYFKETNTYTLLDPNTNEEAKNVRRSQFYYAD